MKDRARGKIPPLKKVDPAKTPKKSGGGSVKNVDLPDLNLSFDQRLEKLVARPPATKRGMARAFLLLSHAHNPGLGLVVEPTVKDARILDNAVDRLAEGPLQLMGFVIQNWNAYTDFVVTNGASRNQPLLPSIRYFSAHIEQASMFRASWVDDDSELSIPDQYQ